MFSRAVTQSIVLVAVVCLSLGASYGQETQALFNPGDAQLIDDITVAGTVETRLSSGLSRLFVRGSGTSYYVVDEIAALQSKLYDELTDTLRNDSDISIGYGRYRTEVVHLRLRGDTFDVRFFNVDPMLLMQATEFFSNGGYLTGERLISYEEFEYPLEACADLTGLVDELKSALRDAVSNIGVTPEARQFIVVDGIEYRLRVRMGGLLEGSFGVGENNGPLFAPVHSVMQKVRACSLAREPEHKTRDF